MPRLAKLQFIGLIGSSLAMRAAHEDWKKLLNSVDEHRQLPALHSEGYALGFARASSWGTCIIVMIAWVVILVLTAYLI